MRGNWTSTILVLALLTSACTGAEPAERSVRPTFRSDPAPATSEPRLPSIEIETRPGPFQLTVDRAPDDLSPGTILEAATPDGQTLATAEIAANGTALIRDLPEGPARLFVRTDGIRTAEAEIRFVPGSQAPAENPYGKTSLVPGFNYLPTRDGTLLSAFVSLPGSAADGPYPTLVEYSGYSPSRPGGDDNTRLLLPSLGYAIVQVNVRGTGCSGGSFDAFEPIQSLDGYDVIETVAVQPWAAKVGMFGVSYPGIMQLFVASTQPPSLAAIAPLSVIDSIGSVLYPGGIYNPGFGETWTEQVSHQARAYGQGWEQAVVDDGDDQCATNQRLRVHNPDLVETIRTTPFTTELTRQRSPISHVGSINVPVFLAGAWQDEQTGGRWPALINAFDQAPVVKVMMYNGLHIDAIGPDVLAAVTEFYDLYLEDPGPGAGTVISFILAAGMASVFGDLLPIDFIRFDPDARQRLRSEYEAAEPIRVLFEQGAGKANLPVPAFQASFRSWPPLSTAATSFHLSPTASQTGIGLEPSVDALPIGEAPIAEFTSDPLEGARTTTDDLSRIWSNQPSWTWPAPEPSAAIRAKSEPLSTDLTMVGPASADLWLSSDRPDGDVEVTISEIQPDGSETYVQSGWLRLSQRALSDESTPLRPIPTGLETDMSPLVPGVAVLARVEILPFAHVFRAGSRVALTIDTPGGSKPQWTFTVDPEPSTIGLHSSRQRPSTLVLPVISDFQVPTPQPACGTLRGQPCRR